MTISRLLAAVLLLATSASAQTFQPANGPWTRAHELVGSTPDGRIFARVGQRLGVTADGGATWTVVSETVAPTRIAGDGRALYGAFSNGVRLSTDGGATWTPFGLDGIDILDLAVDETAYALTTTAVYRLGDLASWQQTTFPGVPGAYLSRFDASGGTVAVGGMEPSCTGFNTVTGLYRSRDGGASWVRTRGTGYVADVAVAPDGTAYFATTDGEGCANSTMTGGLFAQAPTATAAVLRSGGDTGAVAVDAAGQPVTLRATSGPAAQVSDIAITSSGVVFDTRPLYGSCFDPPCGFTSASGLYALRGGRSEPVGFERPVVRALAQEAGTPVVPSDGAVYRLAEDRFEFAVPLGDVRAFVTLPWMPATTLALSGGGNSGPMPSPLLAFSYPLALALTGTTPYELYSVASASATSSGVRVLTASQPTYGPGGILVTTETGSHFRLEYDGLGSVGAVGATTVYAGAIDGITLGSTPPPARLFRSDDRGETWDPDAAGMTARDVFAFAEAGSLHLAGTSNGVFARMPGAAWQPDGLAGRPVFTFTAAPDGLLAGTDDGLFRRDATGTWTRYGDGLAGRSVYAVLTTTDAFGAWTGVGTDAGLFQTRAFGVASEAPAPAALGALSVSTAPNPGRGLRTVRLAGMSGRVSVAVFDGLGRRVADLGTDASAERSWDASRLPAGVYVVRATAESGTVATVRAVVVR